MRLHFCFALSVPLAAGALATDLIGETFEAPVYANNQLVQTGSASQTGSAWFVNPMFLDGKVKITNERSFGGIQSLKYESFEGMPPSIASLNAIATADPVIRYAVDLYRPSTSATGGAQLDAMNTSGGTMGSLRYFNGNLLAMDNLGTYVSVGSFAANTWQTLAIEVVDLGPGNRQVRYFLNGSQFSLTRTNFTVSGAPMVGLSFQSGGGANPTVSYADNLRVSSAAVPEPASMAALGLGIAALIRRRRK